MGGASEDRVVGIFVGPRVGSLLGVSVSLSVGSSLDSSVGGSGFGFIGLGVSVMCPAARLLLVQVVPVVAVKNISKTIEALWMNEAGAIPT